MDRVRTAEGLLVETAAQKKNGQDCARLMNKRGCSSLHDANMVPT